MSDGLGHVGGEIAPLIVLAASSFSASFLIMGISGFVTAGLVLLGITTTGRSMEATATG